MVTLIRICAVFGALVIAAASSSSGGQQSPPPESPSSPAGPPPPQDMNPKLATGLWKSSFGPVKIVPDESRGDGFLMGVWVYDRAGEQVIGSFSGQIDGNVMSFTWQEPATPDPLAGTGYLVFDVTGRSFSGKWWTSDRDRGGDWNGWRSQKTQSSGAGAEGSSAIDDGMPTSPGPAESAPPPPAETAPPQPPSPDTGAPPSPDDRPWPDPTTP